MRATTGAECTMKAIVQSGYGQPEDVLALREINRPVAGDGEVLVRVHAASMHPDVWHVVRGLPYFLRVIGAGLRAPKDKVPGTDVAGHVESVGKGATRFRVGDEVFGETLRGHQWHNCGAYAEFATAPVGGLALKPANITFEQAAAVPTSGLIALQGLRAEGHVRPGRKVLINGAGGSVGAFAVQIAKALGAEVTGVDGTGKLDMLRSIGADHVIDYTQQDFTRGSEHYDLILDIPGNHSFSECRRVLTTEGRYVLIGHDDFGASGGRWIGKSLPRFARLALLSPFTKQLPGIRPTPQTEDPLLVLKDLIEAGKLTPVVDRTYPLAEVPVAIRHLEEGNVKGKIVIAVRGSGEAG